MSFHALDTGQSTSRPFLCFRFQSGSTFYRYTTAEITLTVDGQSFTPDVMSVEALELKPNQSDQRLAVLTRRDLPVVSLLYVTRPRVNLRIYQVQRDDLTAWQVYWTGAVVGVSLRDDEARIIVDAGTGRIDGLLAPQMFGASCQWVLGRAWCPVDITPHTFAGTLTAVGGGGKQLTAAAWAGKGDGYFVNGHVQTPDGRAEVVTAYDTATGQVTLKSALTGLGVGDSATAVAGCDGARSTCEGRFGSATNAGAAWGGFFIPKIDPVKGGVS